MNIGRSGQWRPSVQPYLEKLGEQLDGRGITEHSLAVEVNGVRQLITPYEQELVLDMIAEEGDTFARKHVLVRDALGLRLKINATLHRLNSAEPDERRKLLEEINTDVGLGCQLMHEITQEMNVITAAGEIDEAREFTQYRQALVRVVTEAERAVSGRVESGRHGMVRGQYVSKPTASGGAARGMKTGTTPATGSATGRRGAWMVVALVVVAVAVFVGVWFLLR